MLASLSVRDRSRILCLSQKMQVMSSLEEESSGEVFLPLGGFLSLVFLILNVGAALSQVAARGCQFRRLCEQDVHMLVADAVASATPCAIVHRFPSLAVLPFSALS